MTLKYWMGWAYSNAQLLVQEAPVAAQSEEVEIGPLPTH